MISVIIPVYNLEKYLHASLNSILQQTYTDIEIICVDDLSQDNSLQILQDFAARDPRIHVYRPRSTPDRGLGGDRCLGRGAAYRPLL